MVESKASALGALSGGVQSFSFRSLNIVVESKASALGAVAKAKALDSKILLIASLESDFVEPVKLIPIRLKKN